MKFTYAPGWNLEKTMAKIKEGNNGSRAVDFADNCSYKSFGNKCAIGCFIPEGHVGQGFIGPARELLDSYPDLSDGMPFKSLEALSRFQRTHDTYPDESRRSLHEILESWLRHNVEEEKAA